MKKFLQFIWQKHRLAGIIMFLALALLIYSAVDFATGARHFAKPIEQDRPIELWMSPRYVQRSWGLTKPVLFDIIQLDPSTKPREGPRTIRDVLALTGMTLEEFQAEVEAAQEKLGAERRND